MKDQQWDFNQTWPVCRNGVELQMSPKTFWGPPPNLGRKNNNFYHFFATFALDTAYLRKETSYRQTKMPVSICNVSPKVCLTFRDLGPINGYDPFAHCDSPFGGHYVVASIIVTTCLVNNTMVICIYSKSVACFI